MFLQLYAIGLQNNSSITSLGIGRLEHFKKPIQIPERHLSDWGKEWLMMDRKNKGT